LRRLTSGKGRVVIEIKGLPQNKKWCQKLAKDLKKSLGVGGAYKNDFIEVHGDKMEAVQNFIDKKSIKWKKTGG
jgi:translation initiation factor 1